MEASTGVVERENLEPVFILVSITLRNASVFLILKFALLE